MTNQQADTVPFGYRCVAANLAKKKRKTKGGLPRFARNDKLTGGMPRFARNDEMTDSLVALASCAHRTQAAARPSLRAPATGMTFAL